MLGSYIEESESLIQASKPRTYCFSLNDRSREKRWGEAGKRLGFARPEPAAADNVRRL